LRGEKTTTDISIPEKAMTIDLHTYRQTLLHAVHALRAIQPAAHIHLIYTPELQDPLNLLDDTRRDTALIQPAASLNALVPDKEHAPRLLTLDCRRVAAYLLETDQGLDDPAFEHSITQSHAESALAQSLNREVNNDERDFSECSIGGWLIGADSARTLAGRLCNFSHHRRAWVRWTNPSVLGALWPTMTPEQRFMLLGDATWLVFDDSGTLHQYAGKPDAATSSATLRAAAMAQTPLLDLQQIHRLKNVPLVRDLLESWKAMLEEQGRELPVNAEQQMHTFVGRAQQVGLGAESVSSYAMTAVQLKLGAADDTEWTSLVSNAVRDALALGDLLDTLSDRFWDRYSVLDHDGETEWNRTQPNTNTIH
jgi:hypothetical protein